MRPPEQAGDPRRVAPRHHPVLGTPQQQGRRGDQRQALFKPGITERPEQPRRGFIGPRLFDRPFDGIGAFRRRLQRQPIGRIGGHQPGQRIGALGPGIGRRIGGIEQAEGSDQGKPAHAGRPERGHFRRQRPAHRTAGEIGAIQPRLHQQLPHRHQPVERRVEHAMAAITARKAGQGGHDHRPARCQPIEEGHPARQPAEAGEKAERPPLALAPDAHGEAVDVNGGDNRFAHTALRDAGRISLVAKATPMPAMCNPPAALSPGTPGGKPEAAEPRESRHVPPTPRHACCSRWLGLARGTGR